MFSVSVDLSEFRQLTGRTLDELQVGIANAVMHAAHAGQEEAKRGRFKDQTGALRKGIVARLYQASHLSATWDVVSTAEHSRYVEEGTKAHEIWPKAGYNAPKSSLNPGQTRRGRGKGPHESVVGRGRALRWKDGGGEHFARMVHHPGTAALPFMGPAYFKAESVLYRDLNLLMQTIERVWEQAA